MAEAKRPKISHRSGHNNPLNLASLATPIPENTSEISQRTTNTKDEKICQGDEDEVVKLAVVDFSRRLGIREALLQKLLKKYSEELVMEKLQLLKQAKGRNKISNPEGWLVSSLAENYGEKPNKIKRVKALQEMEALPQEVVFINDKGEVDVRNPNWPE